ncbi:hypothetical protein [Ferrimicrobium sp.]|nr:hypothetical protein [Ferrimicrobium sp.]
MTLTLEDTDTEVGNYSSLAMGECGEGNFYGGLKYYVQPVHECVE